MFGEGKISVVSLRDSQLYVESEPLPVFGWLIGGARGEVSPLSPTRTPGKGMQPLQSDVVAWNPARKCDYWLVPSLLPAGVGSPGIIPSLAIRAFTSFGG